MGDERTTLRLRRAADDAEPPEPAFERLLRRRERKQRNARVASGAIALSVTAALIAGGLALLGNRRHAEGPAGGPSSTAVQSPAPSGQASADDRLVAGPGQFYYWKTVRVMSGGNVVEQMWWAEDGSGRYKVDSGNPSYGTMHDRFWGSDGFPGRFPFETDLSGLSTDPATLGAELRERTASGGASPEPEVTIAPEIDAQTSSLWRSLANLLEMGNATPSLRAALYEIAAGLPGVSVDPDAYDPVRRPAIAVSVPLGQGYPGPRTTLWFDPDTHLLLATQGELGGELMIVVAGGIVDGDQAVPSGDQLLVPPPQGEVPPAS